MQKLYVVEAKRYKGSVLLEMLPFPVSLEEATAYAALLFRKGFFYVAMAEAE